MKTTLSLIAASLLAFTAPAFADSNKPQVKCCTKCCVGRAQLPPVETGKGNCKAHPGSCK